MLSDRDTCNRCYYLYQMDLSSGAMHQPSDFRFRDSWMGFDPSSQSLIVNPHQSVDSAFYIIDLCGALREKITTGLPYASDPAFSPDGKYIVFRGGMTKSKREQGFDEALYILNRDGSGLRRITNYPVADTSAAWYQYKARPPVWHPTEHFVSYQSYQQGMYSIYAVDPETGNNWKLTDHQFSEGYHHWSPDGEWLTLEIFDPEETQFSIGL